jgi:hypothetical protein
MLNCFHFIDCLILFPAELKSMFRAGAFNKRRVDSSFVEIDSSFARIEQNISDFEERIATVRAQIDARLAEGGDDSEWYIPILVSILRVFLQRREKEKAQNFESKM